MSEPSITLLNASDWHHNWDQRKWMLNRCFLHTAERYQLRDGKLLAFKYSRIYLKWRKSLWPIFLILRAVTYISTWRTLKIYMPFLLPYLWLEKNNLKDRNSSVYKMFILPTSSGKERKGTTRRKGTSHPLQSFLAGRMDVAGNESWCFPSSPNQSWLKHTWRSPRGSPTT